MVGHISLEEQVNKEFSLARRKALFGWINARLRRDAARSRDESSSQGVAGASQAV